MTERYLILRREEKVAGSREVREFEWRSKWLLDYNTQIQQDTSQRLQRCEVGEGIRCDRCDAVGKHGPWCVGALG